MTPFGDAAGRLVDSLGARAWIHARLIGGDREVGWEPDQLVVTASVFKVAVLLELCLQVADGTLDPRERVTVQPDDHVLGPTGLSVFQDVAQLSLRDVAALMMSVSDNTATDVVLQRVGIERVNATLDGLGLPRTRVLGDCRSLLCSLADDIGMRLDDIRAPGALAGVDPELLRQARALDPEKTNCSTPRETTALLDAIWTDRPGPGKACAEARRIMSLQMWAHRLVSGLPAGVRYAGKTGTLPGIRNEVGVVSFPEGDSYAVAIFTRTDGFDQHRPDVDAAIGKLGRLALDTLRPATAVG